MLILLLLVLGLYVLLPQISSLHSSIRYLNKPNFYFLAVALGFSLLTFVEAAASYRLLAFRKILLSSEMLVQSAAMFINNLLPAGVGALGANYSYLKHMKHTPTEATSVVAANNLLGLIGHLSLVGVTLLLVGPGVYSPHSLNRSLINVIKVTAIIIFALLIVSLAVRKNKAKKFISATASNLISYKERKLTVAASLIVQLTITLSNVAALYFSARAVGLSLSFAFALLIFTLGAFVKNATPTPGGLGGFEAGLLAGFVAYKLPAPQALAAVLYFRLVTFWLPLMIGAIAFAAADKRKLFSS